MKKKAKPTPEFVDIIAGKQTSANLATGQSAVGNRDVTLAPMRVINYTPKDNNHSITNALVNRAQSSALSDCDHFGTMMGNFVDTELFPRMRDALQLAHACGDLDKQDKMFLEHKKHKEYLRDLKDL